MVTKVHGCWTRKRLLVVVDPVLPSVGCWSASPSEGPCPWPSVRARILCRCCPSIPTLNLGTRMFPAWTTTRPVVCVSPVEGSSNTIQDLVVRGVPTIPSSSYVMSLIHYPMSFNLYIWLVCLWHVASFWAQQDVVITIESEKGTFEPYNPIPTTCVMVPWIKSNPCNLSFHRGIDYIRFQILVY